MNDEEKEHEEGNKLSVFVGWVLLIGGLLMDLIWWKFPNRAITMMLFNIQIQLVGIGFMLLPKLLPK